MSNGQYPLLDSRNLIGIFDRMFEPALNGIWANQLGTIVDSNMETETYGWLGAAPGLEPLVEDNPREEQLKTFIYALRNIDYAKAIKIKENDLRRDKIGQIEMRIGEMAEKAAEHWNVLASSVIQTNPLGYDQQKFFSSTHNEAASGSPAVPLQSNDYVNGNGTTIGTLSVLDVVLPAAPTAAEFANALNAILGQFYTLVDDKGYPINGQAKEFLVVVATGPMWAAANAAVNLFTFAQGAQNPIAGLTTNNGLKIRVEFIPQLNLPGASTGTDGDWTTAFAVFRTDSRVKALVLQNEVPVTPATSTRQNDEYIKFGRYIFAIRATRAVGVVRWQSAIRARFA